MSYTSITSSAVLWGIASGLATIRDRVTLATVESVTLAARNHPPRFRYTIEDEGRDIALSGRIRAHPEGFRVRVTFQIDELTADELAAWGKLYNYHVAGYAIVLRPHDDAALKLEWEMIPESDFDPGFLGDRYLGHTANFTFVSVDLHPAISLKTSLNEFNRVFYP